MNRCDSGVCKACAINVYYYYVYTITLRVYVSRSRKPLLIQWIVKTLLRWRWNKTAAACTWEAGLRSARSTIRSRSPPAPSRHFPAFCASRSQADRAFESAKSPNRTPVINTICIYPFRGAVISRIIFPLWSRRDCRDLRWSNVNYCKKSAPPRKTQVFVIEQGKRSHRK